MDTSRPTTGLSGERVAEIENHYAAYKLLEVPAPRSSEVYDFIIQILQPHVIPMVDFIPALLQDRKRLVKEHCSPAVDELTWPEPQDMDEKPDDEEMDTDTLDHAASYYADLL